MITTTTGNLLLADVDALVNTVNTQGVMGKGIALQFKRAWPEMFKDYAAACRRGEVVPGRMQLWETGSMSGPRFIINFPTKRHWRARSRLSDISTGLDDLVRLIGERDIQSLALPPLGCGNGGLDWAEVEPLIHAKLDALSETTEILLFTPSGPPPAREQVTRAERPAMTAMRAALLAIMREYAQLTLVPPSLVEIQKLAYFLQNRGEKLNLEFVPASYGPYADDLRKTLSRMEGHFISGFGDGSAPALQAEPISVVDDVHDEVAGFLGAHPATADRVDQVLSDVSGYESMYGLELLATVHWVMAHEPDALNSVSAVRAHADVWSSRKRAIPDSHLEHAWNAIRDRKLIPV